MTWMTFLYGVFGFLLFFVFQPLGSLLLSLSWYYDQKRLFLHKEYLEKYPPKKSRFKIVNWWRNR